MFKVSQWLMPIALLTSIMSAYAAVHELPIVVIICSYNNAPWVEKNLDSVFMQQYSNFRVMYIDDCSSDGTPDSVQRYIKEHNLHDKIELIVNEQRQRKMRNMYHAVHLCDDQEIVVQLDGDDWFLHNELFAQINDIYQSQDVWLSYGSYKDHPSGKRGYAQAVPEKILKTGLFRRGPWLYMHPRTFYAWLFKTIKLKDLISLTVPKYEGKFYPAANDAAMMYPMLEMAADKLKYVESIGYVCNRGNPIIGKKVDRSLQDRSSEEIRRKLNKYSRLSKPSLNRFDRFASSKADLILLSDNNPKGAACFLASLKDHVTGVGKIAIAYMADTCTVEKQYFNLFSGFDVALFPLTLHKNQSLAQKIASIIEMSDAKHIVIAKDTNFVSQDINITQNIITLERTFAHGVYFGFSNNQSLCVDQFLWDDVYAWKFFYGIEQAFNNIDMTLIRKKDLIKRLNGVSGSTLNEFYDAWYKNTNIDLNNVGLFFAQPKLDNA